MRAVCGVLTGSLLKEEFDEKQIFVIACCINKIDDSGCKIVT